MARAQFIYLDPTDPEKAIISALVDESKHGKNYAASTNTDLTEEGVANAGIAPESVQDEDIDLAEMRRPIVHGQNTRKRSVSGTAKSLQNGSLKRRTKWYTRGHEFTEEQASDCRHGWETISLTMQPWIPLMSAASEPKIWSYPEERHELPDNERWSRMTWNSEPDSFRNRRIIARDIKELVDLTLWFAQFQLSLTLMRRRQRIPDFSRAAIGRISFNGLQFYAYLHEIPAHETLVDQMDPETRQVYEYLRSQMIDLVTMMAPPYSFDLGPLVRMALYDDSGMTPELLNAGMLLKSRGGYRTAMRKMFCSMLNKTRATYVIMSMESCDGAAMNKMIRGAAGTGPEVQRAEFDDSLCLPVNISIATDPGVGSDEMEEDDDKSFLWVLQDDRGDSPGIHSQGARMSAVTRGVQAGYRGLIAQARDCGRPIRFNTDGLVVIESLTGTDVIGPTSRFHDEFLWSGGVYVRQGGRHTFPNATAISMSARLRKHLRGRRNAPRMCKVRIVDKIDHSKEGLMMLFELYEVDRDGYVDYEDTKIMIWHERDEKVTYEVIEAVVDRFDADCDGKLSYTEFVLMYSVRGVPFSVLIIPEILACVRTQGTFLPFP